MIDVGNEYSWENFINDERYDQLVDFYLGVLGLNDSYKIEWNNVVFLSKKSFQIYLLLLKKNIIDIDKCKVKVYSDSYIINNIGKNLFSHENVCIVDDTLVEVGYFIKIYNLLNDRTSVNTIFPRVFMQSNDIDENLKDIGLSTYPTIIDNTSKLIGFSQRERFVSYNEFIPYTTDLPVITEVDKDFIELTEEQFEKLKNNRDWQYYQFNQYKSSVENNCFNATLLTNNSSFIYIHQSFIDSFTVQLQVVEYGNNYRIVAMPFAILKSAYFEELYNFFMMLYSSTEYGKLIETKKDELGNDFAKYTYEIIYNAVCYNFSLDIGKEFSKELSLLNSNIRLKFLNNINMYSYQPVFLHSTEDIFKNNYNEYVMNILLFEKFHLVNTLDKFRVPSVTDYNKIYDKNTLFLSILRIIDKIKYGYEEKIISIEELERIILNLYYSTNEEELKNIIMSCLNDVLMQNGVRNVLCYDTEQDIVCRGFEPIRANELLVDFSSECFYTAVKEYYDNIGKDRYAQNYDIFRCSLFNFYRENRLYDQVFSRDELMLLKDIFEISSESNVFKSIEDKEFLEEKELYVKKLIKEYIRESDIYYDIDGND